MNKNKSAGIFLLIPLLVLVFIVLIMHEMNHFYFGWFDPVYAYLMNGLTFAKGSLDIGHTDHPGTPLQLFCALIITVVGFFRGTDDLARDVIAHPEFYSSAISWSLVAINVFVLFLLGNKVYRVTQNKWLALIVQLVLLLSYDAIHFMPIVTTESILVFSILLLALTMMVHVRSANSDHWSPLIWLSFLSGLILSTKISALPVLLVPFFFMKGARGKIKYVLFTLVFTFLFLVPVLSKLNNFVHFIGAIFTHTGAYGSGEEKLINWSVYAVSMRHLLTNDIPFTLNLVLLFVGWSLILRKKKIKPALKRIWVGLTLATILAILVVARHYSFHYLLPVYLIAMPLQVWFWYSMYENRIKQVNWNRFYWIVWIFIPLVFLRLVFLYHFYPNIKSPVADTVAQIENNYKGHYVIIGHSSRGGAFPEPALRFGLGYSGNTVRENYRTLMAEYYPDNYIWNAQNGLSNWNGSLMLADLFSKYDSIYIYNRSTNCVVSFNEIADMVAQNGLIGSSTIQKVYENKLSNEVIVLAQNDTAAIRQLLIPSEVIEADMEKRTSDTKCLIDKNGTYYFEGGDMQSKENAFEGNYSVLLTASHPYALKISLPVKIGDRFRVEAWQKSLANNGEALIVASANSGNDLYKTSILTTDTMATWKRCELMFPIPADYPDSLIYLYLWLPQNDSVWIDNFVIERYGAKIR